MWYADSPRLRTGIRRFRSAQASNDDRSGGRPLQAVLSSLNATLIENMPRGHVTRVWRHLKWFPARNVDRRVLTNAVYRARRRGIGEIRIKWCVASRLSGWRRRTAVAEALLIIRPRRAVQGKGPVLGILWLAHYGWHEKEL